MELRQLEYLLAVVEEASFTRAAARLHVAQPGVSAQIRRLEHELGEQLLDRSGRTVRPTRVGEAVLPHVRAALAAVAAVRDTVDEFTGLVRGSVAVGTLVACAFLDLPGLLAGFHRDHPGVDVTVSEGNSDVLVEQVRAGRLDMAFVGLPAAAPQEVATHVISDEPLVAAVAPDDPLAARSAVPLRELAERTLICLPPGTGLRTSLDQACAAAGLTPRVGLEASDPGVVAHLAARGLGVAILPASVADAHRAHLRVLTVTGPPLRAWIALAWRDDATPSPAARALLAHTRRVLAQRRADQEPAA